ncbi:family 54 glycoside hydrolase [Mycena olivaceomarginata]|nr:family 54 glycoside hydrolase [Mycena olivaceomarginata]
MFQFLLTPRIVSVATLVAAGPCDLYASGGTPCVAAHSTTRALFSAFTGSLYQVKRASDGATTNIAPLSLAVPGRGNHLTQAPPGGFSGPSSNGFDNLAAADGAPVTLNGQKAYGVFISPGTGYRNDATNGIATGDAAEGMYARATRANGHMEAIYFGNSRTWGTGSGNGPWIMADLENGLFSGFNTRNNPADPTVTSRFVTAVVKGEPSTWAIRGGNAASGSLSTFLQRRAPQREGAIILGIGGDNSVGAQGTFYEGVMTSGFPSDATENSVQANIVAARYATTSLTSGPAISVGSAVSFRATTACCTTRYIAHTGTTVNTQVVTSSSTSALKLSASWTVVAGLGNSACVSFEARDTPGSFIRHSNFTLLVNANDGTKQFNEEDATFCPQAGLNGQGNTIRAWGYPTRSFRHFNDAVFVASSDGCEHVDVAASSFNDDVSWVVGSAFA